MKKLWKLLRVIAIGAVIMVSAFAVAGCANDSDDGNNNNNGSGGSSLVGTTWVNNRGTPAQSFIFTNADEGAVTGAKIAYYASTLFKENQSASGSQVYISGSPYPITLNGNTLTVTGYIPAANQGGTATDVAFKRVEGTSGASIHGAWVPSSLASNSPQYTLLIIRTGTAETYTSVTSNNWGQHAYTPGSDTTGTYITWGSNTNVLARYTINPEGTLDITPPAGGNQITGLYNLITGW
jgi:hypothetical protein